VEQKNDQLLNLKLIQRRYFFLQTRTKGKGKELKYIVFHKLGSTNIETKKTPFWPEEKFIKICLIDL
jgi:hypothetical protein